MRLMPRPAFGFRLQPVQHPVAAPGYACDHHRPPRERRLVSWSSHGDPRRDEPHQHDCLDTVQHQRRAVARIRRTVRRGRDALSMVVRDGGGAVVAEIAGALTAGNLELTGVR